MEIGAPSPDADCALKSVRFSPSFPPQEENMTDTAASSKTIVFFIIIASALYTFRGGAIYCISLKFSTEHKNGAQILCWYTKRPLLNEEGE